MFMTVREIQWRRQLGISNLQSKQQNKNYNKTRSLDKTFNLQYKNDIKYKKNLTLTMF